MKLVLDLDDDQIKALMALSDTTDPAVLTNESLSILKWMIKETIKGRAIVSCDYDGGDLKQLKTPVLNRTKAKFN